MPRSVWKGPFVDGYLIAKAEKAAGGGRREAIKTWSPRRRQEGEEEVK